MLPGNCGMCCSFVGCSMQNALIGRPAQPLRSVVGLFTEVR